MSLVLPLVVTSVIALIAVVIPSACEAADSLAASPHALIFLIDGIPSDVFLDMLEDGNLPYFKKHIYDRGVYSKRHITIFPPVTFPSIASIFSGRYPSAHHIPNFFWVSRNEATYKNYISIDFLEYQRDTSKKVNLLFEHFPERTLSYGLPLDVGSDYTRTLIGSYVDVFRQSRDLDHIEKTIEQTHAIGLDIFVKPLKLLSLLNPAKETNVISLMNPFSPSGIVRYAIGSFSESQRRMRREIPTAILYYDWRVNHDAYENGPRSRDVRDALMIDDRQFGRIVQAYREAGLYDQTYFFVLSDHGHMRTRPEYVPIDRMFMRQSFKTRFISHELLARTGLSSLLRTPSLLFGKGSVEGYNCVLGTSGGGSVVAFFSKDGGTGMESWEQQVYYEDLFSYPVTREKRIDLVDFINSIDGMNFFLVRESEFVVTERHQTRIVGPTGSSVISAFVKNKPVKLKYEVVAGTDPLCYMRDPALAAFIAEGYHDEREWLRATADTEYPDAPVQIAQYMESPRSGSVVMIPNDDHSFNTRTWSKHGGLSAGEMMATFAVSGPGIKTGTIECSRTVDFAPTFLYLMGKDVPRDSFDGIILPDIFEEEEFLNRR